MFRKEGIKKIEEESNHIVYGYNEKLRELKRKLDEMKTKNTELERQKEAAVKELRQKMETQKENIGVMASLPLMPSRESVDKQQVSASYHSLSRGHYTRAGSRNRSSSKYSSKDDLLSSNSILITRNKQLRDKVEEVIVSNLQKLTFKTS